MNHVTTSTPVCILYEVYVYLYLFLSISVILVAFCSKIKRKRILYHLLHVAPSLSFLLLFILIS
jgi:hypothetical protein